MNQQRILFQAAMAVDGRSVKAAPGAVLVQGDRILAAGSPQHIGSGGPDCTTIDLPTSIITPALVNVHAHLDLTHIGPRPFTGDFASWVELVRANRASAETAIDASVRLGVDLAIHGGTAFIGDIAGVGSLQPVHTLRRTGLQGVSFIEVFGLGLTQDAAISRLQRAVQSIPHTENGVRFGVQPHAPYSCGPKMFKAAVELNLPLATHLAETLEELEFVRTATGPIQRMLQRIGVWHPEISADADGVHPIDQLLPYLKATRWIVAHLNYLDEAHLDLFAPAIMPGLSVAYCPRASAYFGHPHAGHPQHRYRDMLARGINVALGTDSIICLDTSDRLSVLDEMRLLHRRDATDAIILLRMATINGATALGVDPSLVTLEPGRTAGLLAIDCHGPFKSTPLQRALLTNTAPRWLVKPRSAAKQP